ncbi:20S proteasome subunit alpha 3 [Fonticula alba]|uniref:20S proteasome subunit alpha 3 n=1 Tax=Fonticula alba TaxID=691883 RepID=A0A058Z2R8_FONAL|nr:20S proteasome subunit alpha 3 [Fonticula alba]KCV68569.1 20S proteasome subunit alpha 3 [Fonticula alba]|eukprot:XP_009497001.1 20S proteasome subunit alpha 3 [Fonticula alba]
MVEYALEAISHAGTSLGIVSKEGVVLAAERRVSSKLLETRDLEKTYVLDDHVAVCVAGIVSDANTLVHYARSVAQNFEATFSEPMPVEQLVTRVADLKQGYTQFGGLRPYGVSMLYAGWDRNNGYQLYVSDPAGNFGAWRATCVGANAQTAQSMLKTHLAGPSGGSGADGADGPGADTHTSATSQDDAIELTLEDAINLSVKILCKTIESSNVTSEKLEIAVLTLHPVSKKPVFRALTREELDILIARIMAAEAAEKAAAEAEKAQQAARAASEAAAAIRANASGSGN